MAETDPLFSLFGILKLGRVLRLSKIIQYLNVEEDIKASLKLGKLIFFLGIYMHMFACFWWLVVNSDKTWIPPHSAAFGGEENYYSIYVSK